MKYYNIRFLVFIFAINQRLILSKIFIIFPRENFFTTHHGGNYIYIKYLNFFLIFRSVSYSKITFLRMWHIKHKILIGKNHIFKTLNYFSHIECYLWVFGPNISWDFILFFTKLVLECFEMTKANYSLEMMLIKLKLTLLVDSDGKNPIIVGQWWVFFLIANH